MPTDNTPSPEEQAYWADLDEALDKYDKAEGPYPPELIAQASPHQRQALLLHAVETGKVEVLGALSAEELDQLRQQYGEVSTLFAPLDDNASQVAAYYFVQPDLHALIAIEKAETQVEAAQAFVYTCLRAGYQVKLGGNNVLESCPPLLSQERKTFSYRLFLALVGQMDELVGPRLAAVKKN